MRLYPHTALTFALAALDDRVRRRHPAAPVRGGDERTARAGV